MGKVVRLLGFVIVAGAATYVWRDDVRRLSEAWLPAPVNEAAGKAIVAAGQAIDGYLPPAVRATLEDVRKQVDRVIGASSPAPREAHAENNPHAAASPPKREAGSAPAGKGAVQAVEAGIAAPIRRDVPVYATGLGTVQASVTVSIHAQVDGKLEAVMFTEGQHVTKGTLLARIDQRLYKAALDSVIAKKAQDQALLVAAKKDLARFNALADKGFQSQQSIDQQIAKVDQLTATIAADEAAIETARTNFDYTSILAPSDGRIGVRLVDPGNLVRASDAGGIASLVLSRPAAVNFTLPEQQLDAVRKALIRGPVEVAAYDRNNREQLAIGKLLLIDNAVDQASATIKLKAMFPNDDERLWPGQFVNARILIDSMRGVLTIPRTAVQRGPNGLFAWIVTEAGTADVRLIETGPSHEDIVTVTNGLGESDRVVIDGQYKLRVGIPVQPPARKEQAGSAGGRT